MTCKDCVHFELCEDWFEQIKEEGVVTGERSQHQCESFKNKADFVKIPCKCKDCEHFNNYNPDRTYCEEHSDGWGDNIVYVDEDDYCSFGIRKR